MKNASLKIDSGREKKQLHQNKQMNIEVNQIKKLIFKNLKTKDTYLIDIKSYV